MIKNLIYCFSLLFFIAACKDGVKPKEDNSTPIVSQNGEKIKFKDAKSSKFFKIGNVHSSVIKAEFTAPANIAATVIGSGEGGLSNMVLFENPELAGNFSQLSQHQMNMSQIRNINIKQKQIELDRIKDLVAHGAATGQDLLNIQSALSMEQTNLANEKAALIEHESKLISAGLNPSVLKKSNAGTAFLICDIPENQISKIKIGGACKINFTAFPNEDFTGKIDAVADIVDNSTRMVKLRINVNNSSSKLKAGMFANVSFGLSEGDFININKNSLITIQGRNYVFVKHGDKTFIRKEVQIGQQIGDNIIIFSGINTNEKIVVDGVIQLKGLSFGY